jgi:hypothetical protein
MSTLSVANPKSIHPSDRSASPVSLLGGYAVRFGGKLLFGRIFLSFSGTFSFMVQTTFNIDRRAAARPAGQGSW